LPELALDLKSIQEAAKRIAPYIHETPVLSSDLLDDMAGAELFFKAEHLQKVGAFKARGAVNAVFSLADSEAVKGVATHSSGNHGAALARAAKLRGIPACIVVPDNAKQVKKDAIESYGGEIIECAPTLAAREQKLNEVVAQTGSTFIAPYDDKAIICGQGTVALELIASVPDLDSLVIPVGGGGLLSGCAIVARELSQAKVFAAEPEQADDAYRSFLSDALVTSHEPNTIADGLLTTLGVLNFGVIREKVDEVLLVSEDDIVSAMRLVWTRMKQIIEPSSAVTLAAVLRYPDKFRGRKVGLILTGGNVDLASLPF
jgi:threonine dehydratase